jgi:hypothetical protein
MKAFHSPRLGAILLLALAVAEWSQASQPTNTPLAVMTVTGPVAIGELGLVLAHEYVMSTCWAEPAAGPTLRRCSGHRGSPSMATCTRHRARVRDPSTGSCAKGAPPSALPASPRPIGAL